MLNGSDRGHEVRDAESLSAVARALTPERLGAAAPAVVVRLAHSFAYLHAEVPGRGGSVKIKFQGWIMNRTLRGSFSALSTPKFASKHSLELRIFGKRD